MKQYFIKIKPNSNLFSFGELAFHKQKRVKLTYTLIEDKLHLSNAETALFWIKKDINKQNLQQSKIVFFVHGLLGSRPLVLSRNSKVFKNDYINKSKNISIIHIIWNNGKLRYIKNLVSLDKSTNLFSLLLNSINDIFDNSSLICQSMGNRFFFQTIIKEECTVQFNKILLIAPDINVINFKKNYKSLLAVSKNNFIFYHKNDRVLRHSSRINKVERLGRVKLDLLTENIKFIECTNSKIQKFPDSILGHMYFLTSNDVKNKILNLLH